MKQIELTFTERSKLEEAFSPINKAHGIVYCVKTLNDNSGGKETLKSLDICYFEQQLNELSDLLGACIDYLMPYSMCKRLAELDESMNVFLEDNGTEQQGDNLRSAQIMALFGASDFVKAANNVLSEFVETFYPPAQAA
jgi:hypothetical protein